ncbi:hypothetical protein [Phenylobacterium sp.]|uniref:hypothetical protein n=1 Tax=Phenylobacterium sp. TaxID=1871053 RepID=UPI00398368BB
MDGSGLVEQLRSDAAAAADALTVHLSAPQPSPRAASRSAPKQIATIALHAQITRSAPREEALQAAARSLGVRLNITAGGLKKATSEARAILQFGLGSGSLAPATGESSDQLLHRIDEAVRAVNLRQVSRDRAQALAGVRGGRPTAQRQQVAAAVQKLLDRATAGHADAEAELSAIRALILAPPARRADRP